MAPRIVPVCAISAAPRTSTKTVSVSECSCTAVGAAMFFGCAPDAFGPANRVLMAVKFKMVFLWVKMGFLADERGILFFRFDGDQEIGDAVGVGLGETTGPDVDLDRRQQ